jgi:hypothetical protein
MPGEKKSSALQGGFLINQNIPYMFGHMILGFCSFSEKSKLTYNYAIK